MFMSANNGNLNNYFLSHDTGVYCYWDERYVPPSPVVRASVLTPDDPLFFHLISDAADTDDGHNPAAVRQSLRLPSKKIIQEAIWGSCNTPNSGGRPPKNGIFRPDFLAR